MSGYVRMLIETEDENGETVQYEYHRVKLTNLVTSLFDDDPDLHSFREAWSPFVADSFTATTFRGDAGVVCTVRTGDALIEGLPRT